MGRKDKKILRLVKDAIKGNARSFDELIVRNSKSILFIAMSIVHDKELGQEAAQEAVILMKRGISNLENPEYFETWMYRIVHNVCVSELRKMSRSTNIITTDVEDAIEVREERDDFLPEEYLVNDEKRTELAEAINALPTRYKECILLFYYQDMNYSEIAEALEISYQDVANALGRARKKLRTDLLDPKTLIEAKVAPAATMLPASALLPDVLKITEQATVSDAMTQGLYAATGVGASAAVVATTTESVVSAATKGAKILELASIPVSVKIATIATVAVVGLAAGLYIATSFGNASNITSDPSKQIPANSASDNNRLDSVTPSSEIADATQLQEETGLPEEQGRYLIDYVQNSPTPDTWQDFTEEASLMFHEQINEAHCMYRLYTFTEPGASQMLISIERTDSSQNTTIVYATAAQGYALPQDFDIITAYQIWSQQ